MSSTMITILALGFISLVLYQVVRVIRGQLEAARQIRQRLGFTGVEPPDPTLATRLSAILEPKGGGVKVSRVFKRDHGSYALYDCRVLRSRKSDGSEPHTVLVGRGWQLSSLRLIPRLGGEGKGWKLLNRLTLLAVKQGGFEEVTLDGSPELSRKYVVLSRTPQEAARRISREIWADLAAIPEQLFLEAEGDTVIFSTCATLKNRVKGNYETVETDRLTRAIDLASRLNRVFEGCRTGVVNESVLR